MKRVLSVAASVGAALTLAACGSSSSSSASSGSGSSSSTGASSSSTGSSSSSSSSAPKGAPILIGSTTTVNNPAFSFGGVFAALKAGAAVVNKAGGINGHPVQIWTCNSNYNPSQELACARKAVAAGVIAMVGDQNTLSSFTAYAGILTSAHIADVENTGPLPNGFEGPSSFGVTWPLAQFLPCTSPQLAKIAGGNKVTEVSTLNPTTGALGALFAGFAKAEGLQYLKNISVPITAADYSAPVAEAEQSGANIVEMSLVGAGPQAFVRASSAAGAHYTICTAEGLTGPGWAGTGAAANKLYVGSDFQPLSSSAPGMKAFLSAMSAESARGDGDAGTSPTAFQGETMETWLGFQAAMQAAKSITGPVTRTSFIAAMKKTQASFGGIIPSVNFAQAPETPKSTSLPIVQAYQHVWGSPAYLWKWQPSSKQYTLAASYTNAFKTAVNAPAK